MKKVLAITCLVLVLTFAMAAVASAVDQGQWRFYLKADDGAGMASAGSTTIGVFSSSKDGFGIDGPASDGQDVRFSATTPGTARGVYGVFDNKVWSKDVKSPRLPQNAAYNAGAMGPEGPYGAYPWEANRKFWDLRVAGLGSVIDGKITRLQFLTIATTMLPPATLPFLDGSGTGPAAYALRMVNNRNVEGAPANGTIWNIPAPTVHSATAWYSLTLPTINVSSKDEGHIISEGYQMQFFQTPEPSSLLALGAGLMGLAGFASRRRRS